MNFFGLSITRQKAAPALHPVDSRGGWWPMIRESFTGAWQRNIEVKLDSVLSFHAVYACINRIATDVAKLRVKLVEKDENGIWSESESPAYSPVLTKPNRFQTRIQFFQQWIISKLIHGNAYILKVRDNRNVVVAMYVLDPARVKPLVAPDGSVYYDLQRDDLSGVDENQIIVPASEIIHDRMNPLFHPLVGVSPIFACGLAATQGLHIQNNSAKFFQNGSKPGGILTAPGAISDETATRLKEYWEANFTGDNAGRVAVLGDNLKYEAMIVKATDAQLIEQLKWTAETVCSCFAVPPYKIGVGTMPTQTNIEALNQQYYAECLQIHFEDIELLLDEGLEMGKTRYGTEFELDDLLRMDTETQFAALDKAKSVLTLDERRRKVGFKPMKTGGDTVYLQQQDHSLEAIAARDKLLIDESKQLVNPVPAAPPVPADNDNTEAEAKTALLEIFKGLA